MTCGKTNEVKSISVKPVAVNWTPVNNSIPLMYSDHPEKVDNPNAHVLWQHTVQNQHVSRHRVFIWHENHLQNDEKLALTLQNSSASPLVINNIRATVTT